MSSDYVALSHMELAPGTQIRRPPVVPREYRLDTPALGFMTDFSRVQPVTVEPNTTIDRALSRMKYRGVRMLLVTDAEERLLGLLTSRDIQGEHPVEIAELQRIPRSEIQVHQIMMPLEQTPVLNLVSVRNAQIGQIIATLRELETRHVLVVEVDPQTKRQTVCGLFSATQVAKQLGMDISQAVSSPAHSLLEMLHEMSP
jgi:CBS-domain-containing membrane protein